MPPVQNISQILSTLFLIAPVTICHLLFSYLPQLSLKSRYIARIVRFAYGTLFHRNVYESIKYDTRLGTIFHFLFYSHFTLPSLSYQTTCPKNSTVCTNGCSDNKRSPLQRIRVFGTTVMDFFKRGSM